MVRTVLALLFGAATGSLATLYGPHFMERASAPYAGQEGRQISSLSASDVEALLKGEGWGLAKPAEFNGYPGPLHVLELADKLDLSGEQRERIEQTFEDMRGKAKALGAELVKAERLLDEAFKSGDIDANMLHQRLTDVEAVRSRLRAVHLEAHLQVTPLLSGSQKARYASLRGYGTGGHHGHGRH